MRVCVRKIDLKDNYILTKLQRGLTQWSRGVSAGT